MRTPIPFFVSYAHADRRPAGTFLRLLTEQLAPSKRYAYTLWRDTEIPAGERWHTEIQQALTACQLGLLLVSPAFLASAYITQQELPRFLGDAAKPIIPVMLRLVDLQRHDVQGLEHHQFFRLDNAKAFADCTTAPIRGRFVATLFGQIEQRLKRWMTAQPHRQTPPTPDRSMPFPDVVDTMNDADARAEELMRAWNQETQTSAHVVRALAQETSLRDTLDVSTGGTAAAHSVVALDVLQDWALDPHGAPYCAILGEYGIGKTTTLKQFTATLLRRRRDGERVPLPIFIDLRLYSPTIHKGEVPGLETLLQEILDRVWETTQPQVFTAQDILRLVRHEGAILIFDGLDEKLVHLDETQGRAFLRTLWNALPPFEARRDRVPEREDRQRLPLVSTETAHPQGRLVFSCRSHYFKTLRDQNTVLRGEDREGVRASDYRAWVLLPFNEEQIREYLQGVLGPERVQPALDLFAAVHNLRELAERPYLLSIIADHIGELEARQARGDMVHGVTLYGLLVDEWLARDGGKHHLRPEDKLTLMEDIAADMWQDGAREWAWPRVLDWLGARLARDEVLRTRYASIAPALLEEDFRTATFVLRPDSSQESFRFAHTSLQEYFLARSLLRALSDQAPERWAMPFPSPETLDFLGQLLATAPAQRRDEAPRVIEELLSTYRPQATDIALRYWLLTSQRDLPAPAPWRVDLHGADLSGLAIRGRAAGQPFNLVDANLSETQLVETCFEHVDLTGANLTRAQAERAEFHHVMARDITVTEADMTAAVWRYCDALGLRGAASADWYECQWIACDLAPETMSADYSQQSTLSCASVARRPALDVQDSEVTTVCGHGGWVRACGYSPDGACIVSGAHDQTVKVWEARSGKCLRTLEGHGGGVLACGYSPDGACIVSGADDQTVKVWEARSGKCLRTLAGHGGGVLACGYSPDGAYIVSGAGDRTVKVWEARTGEICMTLINAPHGQTAALDERHNAILAASPGAWRYLGWRYFDPHVNRLRILPAEHFGPLPEG